MQQTINKGGTCALKTFLTSFKLFFRNTFFVVIYCLFFVYLNHEFYTALTNMPAYRQTAFSYLSTTLEMSIFCAVLFMLLGYELVVKTKTAQMEECLAATKNGRFKLLLNQLLLIVLLIFVITLTAVIYNFVYPNIDMHNTAYICHMLTAIFVYLFAVPLTTALIGVCLALVFKRLKAYLIMVAFLLLSSPLPGLIAFTIADATRYQINITPFFDIFYLYPVNTEYAPIHAFGISLLPYKIEAILFWAFVAAAVILIKLSKNSKPVLKAASVACAVVSVVNLVGFFQPASKVDMSYRTDGTLFADSFFYSDFYEQNAEKIGGVYYLEEKPAEFQVVSYDLEMTVKKQLYMQAKLKVDKPDLPVYRFTLYHNYKIKAITNQDNLPLRFRQKDDYVDVYSEQPLSELHFTYSGYNTRFYSNPQGIFLPGYFSYYPIAGTYNVYSDGGGTYNITVLPNEADFKLKVNSGKPIFTNLDQTENGTYVGRTNGLTVVSGLYKSTVIDGIEIIYPYFDTEEYSEQSMKQAVADFLAVKNDDIVYQKIIAVPNVNQHYDGYVSYSDHITAEQLIGLPGSYIYTKMHSFKSLLYETQMQYLNDRESFNESMQSEANFPPEFQRLNTSYQEKIDLLGEEAVVKAVNEYLFDNSDRRRTDEFLADLK